MSEHYLKEWIELSRRDHFYGDCIEILGQRTVFEKSEGVDFLKSKHIWFEKWQTVE